LNFVKFNVPFPRAGTQGPTPDDAEVSRLKDNQISKSIETAQKNWSDWRDVFEHGMSDNPLLADPARFAAFLTEYSVRRTIRAGTHEQFRQALAAKSGQFLEAVQDDTGQTLDKLEESLRHKFGTHGGRNRIISVLSKVAAFIRPERFVAWDSYAKRGVNIVMGRTASAHFDTYADYLTMFDKAWEGQPGQEIRTFVRDNIAGALETQPRFLRRVLDVYLMRRGGRWQ
jgi:hypothetical protein